ncbi:hypothetical protein BDZ45DRAFT_350209 [Acephala macrosclerotiorum]|nr:hypothetical protein BDZ45DRAFT_350209 [Acephala macrosclerotiorum]
MAAQPHWQPGIIQYLPYPLGPIPPLHHSSLKARVTWRPSNGTAAISPADKITTNRKANFHLFSKLPLEIRLKIWNFASPARVIEIRSWGDNIANRYRPVKFSTPPQKPPIIFRINHESREEALRLYAVVEIGVSVSILDPGQTYVEWRVHPTHPSHRRIFRGIPPSLFNNRIAHAPTKPYPAQKTYIDFSRDTIYLGPEFQPYHLDSFLAATGLKMELPRLQYLAIDRRLWITPLVGTLQLEHLRTALYALRSRPVKEVYIVPDDLKEALPDKFYYREHEITLHDAPYVYEFDLSEKDIFTLPEEEKEKTVVQNLEEWFERLWNGGERKGGQEVIPPKVEIKNLRRDGRCLSSFKDGIWEVQKVMGGMESWKTWTPPEIDIHTL